MLAGSALLWEKEIQTDVHFTSVTSWVVFSMYLQSLHGLEERVLTSSLKLDIDNYQTLTVSLTCSH